MSPERDICPPRRPVQVGPLVGGSRAERGSRPALFQLVAADLQLVDGLGLLRAIQVCLRALRVGLRLPPPELPLLPRAARAAGATGARPSPSCPTRAAQGVAQSEYAELRCSSLSERAFFGAVTVCFSFTLATARVRSIFPLSMSCVVVPRPFGDLNSRWTLSWRRILSSLPVQTSMCAFSIDFLSWSRVFFRAAGAAGAAAPG